MSSKSSEIEEVKSYHTNGKLWTHYFRINEKILHGEYQTFYNNDNPCVHGFWKDNKRHGEFKRTNKNGELHSHCFYNNGTEEALSEYTEDINNITDAEFMNLSMVFGDSFFASNTSAGTAL